MAAHIAIAGTIGAGKSSLTDFLCKQYGLRPFFEPNAQNPYLADFYADMPRWAFHSQVFFLTHKFRLQRELEKAAGTVVQDRTIYEDAEIFAENLFRQGHMGARDHETYRALYAELLEVLAPPDLLIFLRAPERTLRKRIALRGRPEEQKIAPVYLKQLAALYDEWFAAYRLSETVVIDTSELDYLEDLVDRLDLMKKIEKFIRR
jgi:deoxyadenosine/deoxycytidine kinase